MEQRALLASALVLGCVTAAGAGGFLAVSQMAPAAAEPVERVASGPEAIDCGPGGGDRGRRSPAPERRPGPIAPSRGASGRSRWRYQPRQGPRRRAPTTPAPAPVHARPATARAAGRRRRRSAPDPPATPSTGLRPRVTAPRPTTADARTTTRRATRGRRATAAPPATTDGRRATPVRARRAPTPLPSRTPVSETTAPPAPVRRLETVTIPADAVIGIQFEKGVSTTTARSRTRCAPA